MPWVYEALSHWALGKIVELSFPWLATSLAGLAALIAVVLTIKYFPIIIGYFSGISSMSASLAIAAAAHAALIGGDYLRYLENKSKKANIVTEVEVVPFIPKANPRTLRLRITPRTQNHDRVAIPASTGQKIEARESEIRAHPSPFCIATLLFVSAEKAARCQREAASMLPFLPRPVDAPILERNR